MTSSQQAPTSSNNAALSDFDASEYNDPPTYAFDDPPTHAFDAPPTHAFDAPHHGFQGNHYDLESIETQSVLSNELFSDSGLGNVLHRLFSTTDATSRSYIDERGSEQEQEYQPISHEELLLPLPQDHALFPGTVAELDSTRQLGDQYLHPVDHSTLFENDEHGKQCFCDTFDVVGSQLDYLVNDRARYPQSLHINASDFDVAHPNRCLNNSFSQPHDAAFSSVSDDQAGVDILRGSLARGDDAYPDPEFNFFADDSLQGSFPAGTMVPRVAGPAHSAVAPQVHNRTQHVQRRRGLDTFSEEPLSARKGVRPRARSAVESDVALAQQLISEGSTLLSKSQNKKRRKSHAEREKKHECPFAECDMRFVHPKDLQKHYISRHTNEKPFKCTRENCTRRSSQDGFGRKDWLQRHLENVHHCTKMEAKHETKIYDNFHFRIPPRADTTSHIQHSEEM